VDAGGVAHALAAADVMIDVLDHWRSPLDDAAYPSRWRLRVPRFDVDIQVTPVLADQELNLSVRYWEGAVDVRDTRSTSPLRGRGYVELTGYGAPPGRRTVERTR
jgi:predicted secreted hydrolase